MSDLPNPSNGYVATLDYDLSLSNLNSIFGGMWSALQPYRDVVEDADAAINALNARTLTVIGESITPELNAVRAEVAAVQEAVESVTVDALGEFNTVIEQAQTEVSAFLNQDFAGINNPAAGRVNIGAADRAWSKKSAAYTAIAGDRVLADTSGGAFTLALPEAPATGAEVWFCDPGATWATGNLTVSGNGENIDGAATFAADVDGGYFIAIYDGSAWQVRLTGGAA